MQSTTQKRMGKESLKFLTNQVGPVMGKLPPQAIDIEEAVLGSIMSDSSCMVDIIGYVTAEVFYKESHQEIFRAAMELYHTNKPIDILTVTKQLKENGKIDIAGGAYYVTMLTGRIASTANIEHHARILMELWAKREIIKTSSAGIQKAYADGENVFTLMDQLSAEIDTLQEKVIGTSLSDDLQGGITDAINLLHKKPDNGLTGIPTGCNALDKITGGWQKTDLIYLMARPGMGKTSWILETIKSACQNKKRVAVFSLEMPKQQLYYRLLSNMTEVAHNSIKQRTLHAYDLQSIQDAGANIKLWNLYVNDQARINPLTMRTSIRLQQRKWGTPVDLIVIDYLQMISIPEFQRFNSRDQEIQYISRELKAIAKDFNCPVLCVSSMSRKCEERNDKRPEMSDARDSGSIESDADILLSIYRSSQYYQGPEKERSELYQMMNADDWKRSAELTILKYRHGNTGIIFQEFYGEYFQFRNKVTLEN